MKPNLVRFLMVAALLISFGVLILLRSARQTSDSFKGHAPANHRDTVNAGMMGGSGMMGGRCPMCGGTGMNPEGAYTQIPSKLPKPKSNQWIARLNDILAIEKLSQAQYTADESKYHVRMPYMMIIPQESNHIAWISGLFKAYGLTLQIKTLPVSKSKTVRQAFEIGLGIEGESIPKYLWLINNSEDSTTSQLLSTILLQTRMHHTMFTHALQMGGMGM